MAVNFLTYAIEDWGVLSDVSGTVNQPVCCVLISDAAAVGEHLCGLLSVAVTAVSLIASRAASFPFLQG
jgi:hypothetical protein